MQAQAMMTSWVGLLLIGAVVVLILSFTFVLVLVLLNMAQRRREWEHTERLKALEMGQTIPERVSAWAQASICIAIGAGVPFAAFLFTWLASISYPFFPLIWVAPAVVGIVAVLCSYEMATRLLDSRQRTGLGEAQTSVNQKPAMDADALDVVSQRGG